MLCLSRLPNESIRIGSNVYVTILKVRGDKVRLGIEAPEHIEIARTELDDEAGPDDPTAMEDQCG